MKPERRNLQNQLLTLFFANTWLTFSLFELVDGHLSLVGTTADSANLQPFCRYIQDLPCGAGRCENDKCDRAATAFRVLSDGGDGTRLIMCHAELWNQEVPVLVNGEVLGVLRLWGDARRG
jgi:ligand-binding sensor protein